MSSKASIALASIALICAVAFASRGFRERSSGSVQVVQRSDGVETNLFGILEPEFPRLVQDADAVFVGEIEAVGTAVWYESPPTPGPTPTVDPLWPADLNGHRDWHLFYKVEVGSIYLNNGALTVGESITMSVPVDMDSHFEYPTNEVGDEFLYFVRKSPYDDFYGTMYGSYGELIVDSAPVTYSDDGLSPVPFATAMSVAEFLDELEDEINRQATATLTPYPTTTPDPGDEENPLNPTPTP